MKRKVLLSFSLLAWALICCTLLSFKIEKLMTPRVVTDAHLSFGRDVLPLEALSYDGEGYHLFEMYEGGGWESGLRAREVDSGNYSIVEIGEEGENSVRQVTAYPSFDAKLIRFSSRPPENGEALAELTGEGPGEDTFLAFFPEPVPEPTGLPPSFTLKGRRDGVLLLSDAAAPRPFLESRVRSQLYASPELRPCISPESAGAVRVYSLADIERFMENMPLIAAALAAILFPAAMWAGICIITRRGGGCGPAVSGLVLAALDAVCLRRLIDAIDIPLSVLPRDMIFDLGHYSRELGRVLEALGAFRDTAAASEVLAAFGEARSACWTVLSAGAILTAAVCAVQTAAQHAPPIAGRGAGKGRKVTGPSK